MTDKSLEKRNLWTTEMTESRQNLFQFMLTRGQETTSKKRKLETTETTKKSTPIVSGAPVVVTTAPKTQPVKKDSAKKVKVENWKPTEKGKELAGEKVKAYKHKEISTGRAAVDRRDGVGGGPATGWYKEDELETRITRDYSGARVNQLLVELSTALFEKAKQVATEEQEVECLYISNGRLLVISSNDSRSAEEIRKSILNFPGLKYEDKGGLRAGEKILTRNAIDKLLSENRPKAKIAANVQFLNTYLAEHPEMYEDKDEEEVIAALLVNGRTKPYVEDIYSWLEYQDVAQGLRKLTDQNVKKADPNTAAGLLAEMSSGVLVVENSLQPLHAELTLLYTYIQSGRSDEALIYGRKRPCQGCHSTLVYAQGCGCNLTYNQRTGNWFEGNVQAAISYYGGLKADKLTFLHNAFEKLSKTEQTEIVERYKLKKGYKTMVSVPNKKKPSQKKLQEARGFSTPPNSPVWNSGSTENVTNSDLYDDLMSMDEPKEVVTEGEKGKTDKSKKED